MAAEKNHREAKKPPVSDEWRPRGHHMRAKPYGLLVTYTYTLRGIVVLKRGPKGQVRVAPVRKKTFEWKHWYATERARTNAEQAYRAGKSNWHNAVKVQRIDRHPRCL